MSILKKALLRSVAVIVIVSLSILSGILINNIFDRIDRASHPREFSEYVEKYSKEYGVPEYIIFAVIKTESDFEIGALSQDGARGLMQLMPSTFKWLAGLLGEPDDPAVLYDPETNIKYGTYYLSYLYGIYARWPTVYAAYNAGPNAVDGWLGDGKYSHDGVNLDYIPFEETREYVASVNKATEYYQRLYY